MLKLLELDLFDGQFMRPKTVRVREIPDLQSDCEELISEEMEGLAPTSHLEESSDRRLLFNAREVLLSGIK